MDYSELKDKLQTHIKEHGVPSVQQDQEPDMKSYMDTKAYMESEQYAREFDKAFGSPLKQIDDLIGGLRGKS